MFWSFWYLALRCLLQVMLLRPRSEQFKDLEIRPRPAQKPLRPEEWTRLGACFAGGAVRLEVAGHVIANNIAAWDGAAWQAFSTGMNGPVYALASYNGLRDDYVHHVIDHAQCYAKGHVHTNGLENFWSLLKRTLGGTYVSVEPFHLFRYVDEQAFRFNNRLPLKDADRFSYLVRKIVGKRLTYAELTGKTEEEGPRQEEVF